MIRQWPNRGFTLVEIVLAVSLAAGLTGSAILFYDQAIKARQAITEEIEAISSVRAAMDRITAELVSASASGFGAEGLYGDSQSVQFIATDLPGPVAWAVVTITEDPPPPEQDLRRVSYSIGPMEHEPDQAAAGGLYRTSQKLLGALEATVGVEIVSETLAADVQFLSFRYFAHGQWRREWRGGGLPAAVEITLGAEPLPEGIEPEDYPYETHSRIVCIPAGAAERAETVIRGLEGGRR